ALESTQGPDRASESHSGEAVLAGGVVSPGTGLCEFAVNAPAPRAVTRALVPRGTGGTRVPTLHAHPHVRQAHSRSLPRGRAVSQKSSDAPAIHGASPVTNEERRSRTCTT